MSENNNSSSGIGVFSVLFLIFLTLKLTGVIGWSWWWIIAPLWGGVLFAAIVWIFVFLYVVWVRSKK